MGILSAVFAEALAVAVDVAGVLGAVAEWRVEELHDPAFGIGEARYGALERGDAAVAVAAGEHGPGLGYGVDAAALALARAERTPVREVAAAVPLAVPGALDGLDAAARSARERGGRGRVEIAHEALGGVGEELREPHALAAHGVKAVAPVAAAHEQQPVGTKAAAQHALERRGRVREHAQLLRSRGGCLVARLLVLREHGRAYAAHALGEYGLVVGGIEVFAQRPRQPDEVVGDARAHALVGRARVPPVHDVALGVLVRAGVNYALARDAGVDAQEVCRILELVAESESAAALVYRGAGEHAARERLIYRPAAAHVLVERGVGRVDADAPAQARKVLAHTAQLARGGLGLGERAQRIARAAAAGDDERVGARERHGKAGREPLAHLAGGFAGEVRALVTGPTERLGGKRRGKAHARARVLGVQHAAVEPRRDEGRVSGLGAEPQPRVPAHIARRALYYQHPRRGLLGHKSGHARAELLPARPAEAEGHTAVYAVLRGEQAHGRAVAHCFERLRAVCRALVADPGVYALFAGVVRPHVAEAAVRGDVAEAAVRHGQRPGAARQSAAHGEGKFAVRVSVSDVTAAPRRPGAARGGLFAPCAAPNRAVGL